MEVIVLAPTSVLVPQVSKDRCVKTTLMNAPLGPLCTNVPQIRRVSTNPDGELVVQTYSKLLSNGAGMKMFI